MALHCAGKPRQNVSIERFDGGSHDEPLNETLLSPIEHSPRGAVVLKGTTTTRSDRPVISAILRRLLTPIAAAPTPNGGTMSYILGFHHRANWAQINVFLCSRFEVAGGPPLGKLLSRVAPDELRPSLKHGERA